MSEKASPKIDSLKDSAEEGQIQTPETSDQARQNRIAKIDQNLLLFSPPEDSSKDESGAFAKLEEGYQKELDALEAALGGSVSEEAKIAIHKNIVGDQMDVPRKRAERLDVLEVERLHLLLLTPEQERTIRSGGGEQRELKERAKNGAEIVVRGVSHTGDVGEIRPVVDTYVQENPDIVMIEGGLSLEDVYPGESLGEIMQKDPIQVLKEKGEQLYLAFLATRDGKDVQSWDTSLTEQIRAVLDMKDETSGDKKWTPQDVTDWIITYAARRAYQDGETNLSADVIRGRASRPLPPDAMQKVAAWGIELSDNNIEAALRRHVGLSLKELEKRYDDPEARSEDEAKFIEMTEPELVDERRVTSDVLRDMNIVRDQYAIDKFRELQKRQPNKKLFVIGGASHLTVWRPSIKELYKQ